MNKYQEALDELSFPLDDSSCGGCKCGTSDCQDCKKALAVFKLQELVSKATPKKPIDMSKESYDTIGVCPNCGTWCYMEYHSEYCGECGQSLDWSK